VDSETTTATAILLVVVVVQVQSEVMRPQAVLHQMVETVESAQQLQFLVVQSHTLVAVAEVLKHPAVVLGRAERAVAVLVQKQQTLQMERRTRVAVAVVLGLMEQHTLTGATAVAA